VRAVQGGGKGRFFVAPVCGGFAIALASGTHHHKSSTPIPTIPYLRGASILENTHDQPAHTQNGGGLNRQKPNKGGGAIGLTIRSTCVVSWIGHSLGVGDLPKPGRRSSSKGGGISRPRVLGGRFLRFKPLLENEGFGDPKYQRGLVFRVLRFLKTRGGRNRSPGGRDPPPVFVFAPRFISRVKKTSSGLGQTGGGKRLRGGGGMGFPLVARGPRGGNGRGGKGGQGFFPNWGTGLFGGGGPRLRFAIRFFSLGFGNLLHAGGGAGGEKGRPGVLGGRRAGLAGGWGRTGGGDPRFFRAAIPLVFGNGTIGRLTGRTNSGNCDFKPYLRTGRGGPGGAQRGTLEVSILPGGGAPEFHSKAWPPGRGKTGSLLRRVGLSPRGPVRNRRTRCPR